MEFKPGDYVNYKGKDAIVLRIVHDPLHSSSYVIKYENITKKVQPWELKGGSN